MYKLNSTVHRLHHGAAAAAAKVVMFEGVRLVSSEYTYLYRVPGDCSSLLLA